MTKQDVLRFILTRKSAIAPWKRVRDCVTLTVFIDAFSMLLEGSQVCNRVDIYTHLTNIFHIYLK